jgi:hypothetical protein
MKKSMQLILLLAISLALLILTGCDKDGDLKIINRTDYNVYAGVSGSLYTIPADSTLKLHITTGRQTPFDSNVGKYVEVFLEGETYQIWDAYEETYIPSTEVWINAGKTTNIYLDPNRASVKVVNQSGQYIKRILVQRNTTYNTTTQTYEFPDLLPPGGVWHKQQNPATPQAMYYYLVQVVFENDTILTYGDTGNILYKGDQFLVTVLPPGKQ